MAVLILDENNFSKEVLECKGSVIVDFYADWCGPCKMMAPIFQEAAAEAKEIKFGKLNVDKARDIAMKYGVMSIPTLIVFRDGEVKAQVAGVQDKKALIKMANES